MDPRTEPAPPARHHLEWDGSVLELGARRTGLRTHVVLYRDGEPVAEEAGTVRVLLPAPKARPVPDAGAESDGLAAEASPKILALAVLPGVLSGAFLMIPKPSPTGSDREPDKAQDGGQDSTERSSTERPGNTEPRSAERPGNTEDGGREGPEHGPPAAVDEVIAELPKGLAELVGFARAERRRFEPPAGTLAARLLTFQRKYPRLYASRHVVLAVGKVLTGLLGVALFVQFVLQRVIEWVIHRLPSINWPDIDLPSIPLPQIDLPSIPLPDIDLPDVTMPDWLRALVTTAKYWVPILVATGIAVQEVRRRTGKRTAPDHAKAARDGDTSDHEEDVSRANR